MRDMKRVTASARIDATPASSAHAWSAGRRASARRRRDLVVDRRDSTAISAPAARNGVTFTCHGFRRSRPSLDMMKQTSSALAASTDSDSIHDCTQSQAHGLTGCSETSIRQTNVLRPNASRR
jgi:hypothetical protein